MAFAPRRRARRLWGYWRAEQRTLRQGFVALLLSTLAAFVAGIALGSITHTLEVFPGLFILIPAVLSMRGTIFGAMGARLGTSTHAGLFEVTRARTGVLYQNVFVAVVLTLFSSLYLALLARAAATAFGLESISAVDFMAIAVVGGVIDSALILGLTVLLSVICYRRNYDLDAVSTPIITAVADMVTVPTIWLATFVTRVEVFSTGVAVVAVVASLALAIRGLTTDLKPVRRILLEMLGVVLLTPFLDILAGTVVEARLEQFEEFPALLVIIPPFVAVAGALGGILSSRLSSKLQLGLLTPRRLPEAPAVLDGSLVVGFAVVIFTVIGALGLAYGAVTGTGSPGAATMLGSSFLAGMIATVVALVVAYYVAIGTSRFGLDPDNHSVPIITSVLDLAGVVALLLVLSLSGVTAHG
jgi:mgtE-like transporter